MVVMWLIRKAGFESALASPHSPKTRSQGLLPDFEGLDIRYQEAQLQAILNSVYVFREDKKLEFRG